MPSATSYPSIVGDTNSPVTGIQAVVDPSGGLRVNPRPVDWGGSGTAGGHFAAGQLSGSIAATPTALDPHASMRWTDAAHYGVLLKVRVGWGVLTAITTAVVVAYQAQIARGFSVDYVTGSTALAMAATNNTQKVRDSFSANQTGFSNSLLGSTGLRITTTGAMSGHTNTLDTAPIGYALFQTLNSVTATGTAVALQAGVASPMQDVFNAMSPGSHPVVLSANEGVVIRLVNTGWATGTVQLFVEWTWAEVLQY